jgi:hypothetical protein
MATIRREIEVEAPSDQVQATWEHFVHWIINGSRRLVCDEFACVNAVDSGNVTFAQNSAGTRVTFQLEVPDDEPAPSRDQLEHHVTHDLLVFKDYIERGGMDTGKPTSVEEIVLEHEADLKGDAPRHVRLSSENDTTFWRHHFPT